MSFQYVAFKEGEAPQRTWVNQRASVRYQCGPATSGRVRLGEKQEFLRAWVLDLSTRGVGVLLPRPLEVGQRIVLNLKSSAGPQAFALPARVMHVTARPQGEWVVGLELDKPLTGDDLDALL